VITFSYQTGEGKLRTFITSRLSRVAAVTAGSGALLAGMLMTAAGPADAGAIACGTTITASVTLTQNVDCTTDTTDDAITIGAPDVTVNLHGHQILGPGDSAGTEGIVDLGYSDVTVEYGAISNFSTDVDIEGASGADLTGIVVHKVTTTSSAPEASDAVYGDYLSEATIGGLSISDAFTGVELDNSEGSTVWYNHLISPFFGLVDYFGTANTWSRNSLSNVSYCGLVSDATTDAVIRSSTMTGAGADGICDEESAGISVTGNTLSDLYDGLYLDVSTGSTVSHNKGWNDAYGLYAGGTADDTYSDNKFDHGQYGIETDFPTGEVLAGNVTSHNSEVGSYVFTADETGYSAALTHNTANDNRFGLYAQFLTTGSGNHASGNAVVNCVDVACAGPLAAAGTIRAPAHHPPAPPRFPAPRANHQNHHEA
jgi:parallel beta-helix repeat protein